MTIERTAIDWGAGSVSAIWHPPASGATYLVLAHGAGGTMHTPQLKQFAEAMAAENVGVVRFNFPYAEAGRKAPDPAGRLEACWRGVVEAVRPRAETLYLGGRSMGGRIASQVAAKGVECDGLVFLAYPLHPPGRPEKIRDVHLPDVRAPMLFLQGTRDSFARPDLLAKTITSLSNATLYQIQDGDHSQRVPGRPAADVTAELVRATLQWMQRVSEPRRRRLPGAPPAG